MAYAVTITKQSVSIAPNGIYTVTLGMSVSDGAQVVFETSLSERYNPASGNLETFKVAIQAELKRRWDQWAAERAVYTAAALNTLVSQVQTAANAYVNA